MEAVGRMVEEGRDCSEVLIRLSAVRAQRLLGAAGTSAYYAVSPFIGALFSVVLFYEWPPT